MDLVRGVVLRASMLIRLIKPNIALSQRSRSSHRSVTLSWSRPETTPKNSRQGIGILRGAGRSRANTRLLRSMHPVTAFPRGNRQANNALHRIVLPQMRHGEPRTMVYFKTGTLRQPRRRKNYASDDSAPTFRSPSSPPRPALPYQHLRRLEIVPPHRPRPRPPRNPPSTQLGAA